MGPTDRRRFLLTAMGTGGLLALGAAARRRHVDGSAKTTAEAPLPPPSGSLPAVKRTTWALGSKVSMTVLHASGAVARRALAAATAELDLVEEVMSLYRPESQLVRLNQSGVLDRPHPYLVRVLDQACTMSRRTDGAFDATVQRLWAVYARASKAGRPPEAAAVDEAAQEVDWRQIRITPGRIRLLGRRTAVTLNGIAQGFAADRVTAALRRHGVRHALVDTGEIGSLGAKADGEAWKVGIQHPRREDACVRLVQLEGRSLATSGDYATSFSRDHRDNHLFDPRTGRSPQEFSSVSIAARTAAEADALSTAVFVLGLKQGLQLVRSTPAADAMLVLKDGTTLATEGFPKDA